MKKIKIDALNDTQVELAPRAAKHICRGKKVVLEATGCMGNLVAVSTIRETERILLSQGIKMHWVPNTDKSLESIAADCGDKVRMLWTLMLAEGGSNDEEKRD